MASGWSGIRRATVDRLSPRSHRRLGCWRQIKVSPPGQNSAASARISSVSLVASARNVSALPISTGVGIARPRPFARSSRRTPVGSNASVASP